MTNHQRREAPQVSIADALTTSVMALRPEVDKLDDRGPEYAIELCRRMFSMITTWAAVERDKEDGADPQRESPEQVLLRELWDQIHQMYADRPDRTVLALALGVLADTGHRHGVDLRQPASPSSYPEASIARDVALMLIGDHVQRMPVSSLPEHAAALLITRIGEVSRPDLMHAVVQGLPTTDNRVRDRLLAEVLDVLPPLRQDVLARLTIRKAV